MQDLTAFTIGPAEPVTDSRVLPVITPDDEGGFVTGADLEAKHPDNKEEAPDDVLDEVLVAASPEEQAAAEAAAGASDEPEPPEAELDRLADEVDTDDVDTTGFGVEEQGFVGLDELDDPRPERDGGQ